MPASPRPTSKMSSLLSAAILCGLTAVLLPLAFPPFYAWPVVFIALAPLCLCVIRRPLKWRWIGLYYLAGAAFFVPNLFWLWPVTFEGTLALSLFVALYFALFAFALHRLVVDLRLLATFAVPIAWTAVEFARGVILWGGFPWFTLGNVFAPNGSILETPATLILQTADLFGVWGLTFLAASVNGFVVDALRLPLVVRSRPAKQEASRWNPALLGLGVYTLALLVAAVGYGAFRVRQGSTSPGPTVAVVQDHVTQSNKESSNPADQAAYFEKYFKWTEQAAATKPDMIAWPETMVPGWFDADFLLAPSGMLSENGQKKQEQTREQYLRFVRLAQEQGVALLLGVPSVQFGPQPVDDIRQNVAMLMEPRMLAAGAPPERLFGLEFRRYAKVHLVPFGEYTPFREGWPWLYRLLIRLSPYQEDPGLTPGREWTRFVLQSRDGQREYRFGTPICFEDVMPAPSRQMARLRADGSKGVDFLVNISNDGWFHAVELDQHLQACQVRAVENRVPIARSVNTGNSGFVDSHGRIVKLVRDPGGRSIAAGGWASWRMELDSRVALYTRVGDLFPILCGIVTVLLVAWTFVRPRRAKPGRAAPDEAAGE